MSLNLRRIAENICWVTYGRSFLVTLGLAFMALTGYIWLKEGDAAQSWAAWAYFIVLGFIAIGLTLIVVGFGAGNARVEKWADDASRGGALGIVVIIVLALPVYLLISLLKEKSHES
jgi:hypothetical protein